MNSKVVRNRRDQQLLRYNGLCRSQIAPKSEYRVGRRRSQLARVPRIATRHLDGTKHVSTNSDGSILTTKHLSRSSSRRDSDGWAYLIGCLVTDLWWMIGKRTSLVQGCGGPPPHWRIRATYLHELDTESSDSNFVAAAGQKCGTTCVALAAVQK